MTLDRESKENAVLGNRSLADLDLDAAYTTSRGSLIEGFYLPCLSVANYYDRAVGYFRSSLYVLVGVAMSDFALQGGRIRLICSPSLAEEDIEAIEKGISVRDKLDELLLAEMRAVLEDPRNRRPVELLATLVACEILDLRIAFRPNGIFHDKLGIFLDRAHNVVSFTGSANETFPAWDFDGNHESVEVFKSWLPGDAERTSRHRAFFESLWEGHESGVTVCDFPSVPKEQLLRLQNPDGVEAAVATLRRTIRDESPLLMSRTTPKVLQEHQRDAVENWYASGQRGVLKHATGSGKTLTALEICRRWLTAGQPAIIVVPTEVLVAQWRDEIDAELASIAPAVLQAGAGSDRSEWADLLPNFTMTGADLGARLVIATTATASTDEFISRVRGGQHLLVIADEVHTVGSPTHRKLLTLQTGGRLGMSATPERFGDPVGTTAIFEYFGETLQPEFTLSDAIKVGRLVPYDYHVHLVSLLQHEQDEWVAATDRISLEYARLPDIAGEKVPTEHFKMLLIQRARIVKRAAQKVALAQSVLRTDFRQTDRWLIYCDDQSQLVDVVRTLRESGFPTLEYHSAMRGSRSDTLHYFEERGGVLVAIKCLDEGVDIPSIDHALILASSTNPREFIQRRGRVLRKSTLKFSAEIHDILVTLDQGGVRTLIDSDLRRALQFAGGARNLATSHELEMLARQSRRDVAADYEPDDET